MGTAERPGVKLKATEQTRHFRTVPTRAAGTIAHRSAQCLTLPRPHTLPCSLHEPHRPSRFC
jgi:hypothetical protein